MTQELEGVRLKLERAKLHMDALDRACRTFTNSTSIEVVSEIDDTTEEQSIRAVATPEPPPVLPVIGDVLYNYRSALDQLAWQLVLRAGAQPTSRTEFPLFNDQDRFERDSVRKVAGMSDEMISLIREHQPCFGTNQYANRSLWALQEYGNIDKHRRLLVFVAGTAGMVWDPPGAPLFVHQGPVREGTVLARFAAGSPKGQIGTFPTVVFGEGASQGEDVQMILGLLELRLPRILREFEERFF